MITWTCQPFHLLTPGEVYAILRLRNAVFVVEQQCVFQDADDKDHACWHLMARDDDASLVAYARLVPPGVTYEEPSIGRIVTDITVRGSGFGRELMQHAIGDCRRLFGNRTIRIGAQLYLRDFYTSFGFVPSGGIYPEDGIPHMQMLLT